MALGGQPCALPTWIRLDEAKALEPLISFMIHLRFLQIGLYPLTTLTRSLRRGSERQHLAVYNWLGELSDMPNRLVY